MPRAIRAGAHLRPVRGSRFGHTAEPGSRTRIVGTASTAGAPRVPPYPTADRRSSTTAPSAEAPRPDGDRAPGSRTPRPATPRDGPAGRRRGQERDPADPVGGAGKDGRPDERSTYPTTTTVVDDGSLSSHELLARELGAQVIEDIRDDVS